jgi:methionyl-tRNA formyltransferase
MDNKHKILFLGKANDPYCARALAFCRQNFVEVTDALGNWRDPLPDHVGFWEGDYIISYLSRWVVPDFVLARARVAAINLHPASPEYPGIGCNNFALYENASEYGVTCHHMAKTVDTGSIIAVKRFPVFAADDVASLLTRTYEFQLVLFYEIASLLIQGRPLPESTERWSRKPFTRKQFDDLCRITPDMTQEEVAARVRATTYDAWKPRVELHGYTFELKP